MKRSKKAKIKDRVINLTIEILEHFYNIGGAPLEAAFSKKSVYKIFNQNIYREYSEVPFAKWLYRLRDQEYLCYSANSDSVQFTTKSKLKLIWHNCKKLLFHCKVFPVS